MKRLGPQISRSNPFSTRFVRPGAIGYRFAAGESTERLVARLAGCDWRGQIVGPHGSGKSTLLAALGPALAAHGRRAWSVRLHDGASGLPSGWARAAAADGANLIIVDGYEQLGGWQRFALRARCRRRGWGLLATAHGDVGLPLLYATAPSLTTTQAIVRDLIARGGASRPDGHDPPGAAPLPAISADCVAECYAACDGNVRETLFALYDRWESARG